MFKKMLSVLRARSIYVICIVIALAVTACIAVSVIRNKNSISWEGSQIVSGIPEFPAEHTDITESERHLTAYYENVTSASVAEYQSLLAEECGIVFPPSKYPCTASFGEKFIILHYSAAEMKLSVTVTYADAGNSAG